MNFATDDQLDSNCCAGDKFTTENETVAACPTIYYTSRTQKQLQQVIKELERNTPYRPKMTVLGSRDHYCINKSVLRKGKNFNRNEQW